MVPLGYDVTILLGQVSDTPTEPVPSEVVLGHGGEAFGELLQEEQGPDGSGPRTSPLRLFLVLVDVQDMSKGFHLFFFSCAAGRWTGRELELERVGTGSRGGIGGRDRERGNWESERVGTRREVGIGGAGGGEAEVKKKRKGIRKWS